MVRLFYIREHGGSRDLSPLQLKASGVGANCTLTRIRVTSEAYVMWFLEQALHHQDFLMGFMSTLSQSE